jgi:hypothetical protein
MQPAFSMLKALVLEEGPSFFHFQQPRTPFKMRDPVGKSVPQGLKPSAGQHLRHG